jgi:hypothetical protein
MKDYEVWNMHSEEGDNLPEETVQGPLPETLLDTEMLDALDKMIRDGDPGILDARNLKKLEKMRKDAKTPLFNGSCMTKLEANLLLLEMKSRNGLSDKGFDHFLTNLKTKMLPQPNGLPGNTYAAKQMICPLGLEVQKIHACYNDCILYRGKYVECDQCPVCELSRFKGEDRLEVMTIAEKNKRPSKRLCGISL